MTSLLLHLRETTPDESASDLQLGEWPSMVRTSEQAARPEPKICGFSKDLATVRSLFPNATRVLQFQ